jgi:hypothetical protein
MSKNRLRRCPPGIPFFVPGAPPCRASRTSLAPSPARFGWERVGVRDAFRFPIRSFFDLGPHVSRSTLCLVTYLLKLGDQTTPPFDDVSLTVIRVRPSLPARAPERPCTSPVVARPAYAHPAAQKSLSLFSHKNEIHPRAVFLEFALDCAYQRAPTLVLRLRQFVGCPLVASRPRQASCRSHPRFTPWMLSLARVGIARVA